MKDLTWLRPTTKVKNAIKYILETSLRFQGWASLKNSKDKQQTDQYYSGTNRYAKTQKYLSNREAITLEALLADERRNYFLNYLSLDK